ncbi:hypothetical protein [Faecalispora anaeroviscerum]|uniref:hypothetical protein n=1 Tax=Faecalispora anaeroviscerum TaxID=2991836 RepID=UPI0024B95A48|nr:hypothetical protein [Faecalispora anaeroviscerum]
MKDVKETRCFWASFFATLCLIILVCGIIMVDYQTARVGFGQSQPLILVQVSEQKTSLSVHVMGAGGEWDITALDQWAHRAEDAVMTAVEEGQKLLEQIPLQKAYK